MRIISGKYKGRRLGSFEAAHIRPTTDRVKESLFNILQNEVEGAQVLDLFAGTGNLGLEALSRGAEQVTFVEKSKKSLNILKKNIDLLGIEESFKILQMDVFSFLKTYKGPSFDLIFVDPPFTEKMAHDVMKSLSHSQVVHENSIIGIESERREKIDEDYDNLIRYDFRNFGDKILSFFQRKNSIQAKGTQREDS